MFVWQEDDCGDYSNLRAHSMEVYRIDQVSESICLILLIAGCELTPAIFFDVFTQEPFRYPCATFALPYPFEIFDEKSILQKITCIFLIFIVPLHDFC